MTYYLKNCFIHLDISSTQLVKNFSFSSVYVAEYTHHRGTQYICSPAIKETVVVISIKPPFKEGHLHFYPSFCSINPWIDDIEKPKLKLFNFQREKHGYLLCSWMIRQLIKGYRCRSDMPLNKWKVRNNVFSIFEVIKTKER